MLYTNFEHITSLKRQLPYLRAIAKSHLLVVIFFENTELEDMASLKTNKISEIYDKTIAQEFVYNKKLMVKELEKNGIQAILTKPKDLSVNTINKYLEIKAKGLL
jgi:CRISPR/Cas system-associated protein Cas7 (RAMP superfamily)